MSNRGSITSGELQGKLTMLEVACHRCERKGRVSLARLIEEHGADKGLPDLWENLAGDCPNARSTAVNRCAIYYPELPALFLTSKGARPSRAECGATGTCRVLPCFRSIAQL
jgi:hypothetical protein